MRQADLQQHLRDRGAEMALEAELQRADADAGCSRQLREMERLGGMGMEAIARPSQRAGQGLARAREFPDRFRQPMAVPEEKRIEQRLAAIGSRDRRPGTASTEALGKV